MRTGVLLAITLALAWTAGAQQAPAPKAQHGKLMAADTNKDGKVSFEEFSAARPNATQEQFKRLDRNADGFLSKADRAPKAAPQPTAKGAKQDPQARLKACDKDADGRVTPDEFKAGFPNAPADRFTQLDRDKDGVLTKKDARTGTNAKAQRNAMGEKLRAADTDNDARVSWDEAKAAVPTITRERFDRADRNKDGFIAKDDRVKKP